MKTGYRHHLSLPNKIPYILNQEIWIFNDATSHVVSTTGIPVKFAADGWILLRQGNCSFELGLDSYNLNAPALIHIQKEQILVPHHLSPDFQGAIMVLSREFTSNLLLFLEATELHSIMQRHPVVPVPERTESAINRFLAQATEMIQNSATPYLSQGLLFKLGDLIFNHLPACYEPYSTDMQSNSRRITDQFLQLAQKHFKSERFLEFYADRMGITTKHLSRTLKKTTGITAGDWIERFVVLEAKMLLQTSPLNIQQISDELNFPSQSMFGKYFKKNTGLSPRDYRNNHSSCSQTP